MNKLKNNADSVKQRFATRKLKVGLVSVLLGFTMIFGSIAVTAQGILNDGIVFAAEGPQAQQSQYEDRAIGYSSYRASNYGFQGDNGWFSDIKGVGVYAPNYIKHGVEVQRVGEETPDGIQEWRIIYNQGPIWNQSQLFQGDDYKPNKYTSSPRLGFTLSKDISIVDGINFSITYKNDSDQDITVSKKINKVESDVIIPSENANMPSLDQFKFIEGAGATDRLKSSGFPGMEMHMYFDNDKGWFQKWMDRDAPQSIKDQAQRFIDSAQKVYSFQLNTKGGDFREFKRQSAVVEARFKTKSNFFLNKGEFNPLMLETGEFDSGVGGIYYSYDDSSCVSFADISTKKVNNIDSDGDGLLDLYERYLGSDPHDVDTDGDGRHDVKK